MDRSSDARYSAEWMILVTGLVCCLTGCGSKNQPVKEQQVAPTFNPTVTVRCRMTPDSADQNLATLLRTAIEETVRKKKRVTLVDDAAEARLLLDFTFFLKPRQGSGSGQMSHHFQIVDTKHDVVVFADVMAYSGAPYSDSEAVTMVNHEFEKLVNYLEKKISASSQIELGRNDVAYLEGSLRKGAQANYFRFDHDKSPRRIHVDYPLDSIGTGFAGIATSNSVDKVYEIAERQKLELAATIEDADLQVRISGSASRGQSYAQVFGGEAAPAATNSGAAMHATIALFAKNETEPKLEIHVSADGPTESKLKKSPQEISVANFKSALGKEIGKLSTLLETTD